MILSDVKWAALLGFALLGAAPLESPSPTPTQTPAPQIATVSINPAPVHPGDDVVVTIETTSDVVAVDAKVRGFTFHIDSVDHGVFRKSGHVPKIARFFKGTYHVTFIARTGDGQTAQSERDIVLN